MQDILSSNLINADNIQFSDFKFGLELLYKANTSDRFNDEFTYYILDFDVISSIGFGFSIGMLDISGAARKSVQQTKGDENNPNFYIDAYSSGLDRLKISGAVELPAGFKNNVVKRLKGSGSSIKNDISIITNGSDNNFTSIKDNFPNSLLDALETMYKWNNNPDYISRGDKVYIHDYMGQKFYEVTFMNRSYSDSSEKQFIKSFNFDFIILNTIDLPKTSSVSASITI